MRQWGAEWLRERAAAGYRAMRTTRSSWRAHVEPAPWIDLDMARLTRADVRHWMHAMLAREPALAAQTIKNALVTLRSCLEVAVDDEVIAANPAREVRIPRTRAATSKDRWTVLRPEEQARLIDAVPFPERWLVEVALGTGVRLSELWALHLVDVHMDARPRIVVRYGRFGSPTKPGRVRTVPLFGRARLALQLWIERGLPGFDNPHGLVFPSAREGRPRYAGQAPHHWSKWKAAARLGRRFRWHDLRHTCASSLLAGWWGRRWSLEEVCALLGHSSITVTERYAHFVLDTLERAADETDPTRALAGPGPGVHKAGGSEPPAQGGTGT